MERAGPERLGLEGAGPEGPEWFEKAGPEGLAEGWRGGAWTGD